MTRNARLARVQEARNVTGHSSVTHERMPMWTENARHNDWASRGTFVRLYNCTAR